MLAEVTVDLAFECEVTKQIAAMARRPTLHHWRSSGGAEADLLFERDGVLHTVDSKLPAMPNRRQASGIEAFRAAHSHHKVGFGALTCAVDDPRWDSEDVIAMPWNLL